MNQETADMTNSALSLLPAQTYSVGEPFAAGVFGKVYRGQDIASGQTVAIKVYEGGDVDFIDRLQREVAMLKACGNSGASVRLLAYYVSPDQGSAALVFEFVSGPTLEKFVNAGEARASESIVAAVAIQLCAGLAKIHEAGIVHRDIKPSNIMITTEGRVVFLDFGIAAPDREAKHPTFWNKDITEIGVFVGTPRYAAPEMITGEGWGFASDVYSLGITILSMLIGRHPFDNSKVSQLWLKMVQTDFTTYLPESLKPRWARILAGALAQVPNERISVSEMLRLLESHFPQEAKTSSNILAKYGALHPQPAIPLPRLEINPPREIEQSDGLTRSIAALASQINEVQAAVADVTIIVKRAGLGLSEDKTKPIKRQQNDAEEDPVLKTFATVRHRLEVNWKISLVMTLVLFLLFVGMLILAVVFSVIYQHSYLGFVFGGTSALSLLTVVLWKPMDKMLFATVATQQLELIQLNYQRAINGNRQERREAYRDVNDQINALLTKLTKPAK